MTTTLRSMESLNFQVASARSASVVTGFSLALVVEALCLHLWLRVAYPVLAWSLTSLSLVSLIWLIADYRALGRPVLTIVGDRLELTVGHRVRGTLPITTVARAWEPEWRDIPSPETAPARGYRNVMKPSDPNLLLALSAPIELRGPGGLPLSAQLIGLCLDDPRSFLESLGSLQIKRHVAVI